jgi:hypothetical protein
VDRAIAAAVCGQGRSFSLGAAPRPGGVNFRVCSNA